jgi:hypothetical protein
MVTGLPTASATEYPNICSAPGFQDVMVPSRVFVRIASADASTIAASRPSVCSCRRRSVISRNTTTAPTMRPSSVWIGAALSSMGISRPSFESSRVWFARPVTAPSRSTFSTGLSTVRRDSSLTITKIFASRLPTASVSRQPVSASATGFMRVMRPAASVAMTASPILVSVVLSRSLDAAAAAVVRRQASFKALITPPNADENDKRDNIADLADGEGIGRSHPEVIRGDTTKERRANPRPEPPEPP